MRYRSGGAPAFFWHEASACCGAGLALDVDADVDVAVATILTPCGSCQVIAEAHFDGSRNMVAMISGVRRWIMAHPNQCESMYLLPNGHPSGRHSDVDWSNPDLEKFPDFPKVT